MLPKEPPLRVGDGATLIRNGRPFRGIGVNYFDAFYRRLKDPGDATYQRGLEALADLKIPFARFMAGGFWPKENRLYLDDPARYFALLDGVVRAAERSGVGLIPSLFWNASMVPDLVGEPVSRWGDAGSKTHAFLRRYTRDVVVRYRDSPAIWAWEFGNEYNLPADLPNAAEWRPAVAPDLGTPKARSAADELTHAMVRTAIRAWATEVRKHDPRRLLFSGNSLPRPSAWHQQAERSWKADTPGQYARMLLGDNPDPINTLCVHLYPSEEKRWDGRIVTPRELLERSQQIARKARKPLFVGEFGASEESGPEKARGDFQTLLDAIVQARVPLAALWVYDHAGQDKTWNVTAANKRVYQLKAVSDANRRPG